MTVKLAVDSAVEEKILRVVGGINNLPTPPIVFSQIQKVLNNPNTSAFDIAAILQEDPAISAKVLKLTNSAYYGLAREIESVRQAVVIVGIEAVKNLVLSASVFDTFSKKQIDKEFQDLFWRHSLAVAFACRLLAHKLRAQMSFDSEASFSAGMLHDIGKMVISVFMLQEQKSIIGLMKTKTETPDHALEEEILGYNHGHIGALLGKHWKLPTKLIEAVNFHHFPQLNDSGNNLPYLVHLADHLAHHTFDIDTGTRHFIEPLESSICGFVGIGVDDLFGYANSLREEYGKSETFMEMAKGL